MLNLVQDPQIQQVLLPAAAAPNWQDDLDKLISGDTTLDRRSAGEDSIRAFQRLLIFLGYSTSSSGSFGIDGDFGRGTNRGLAQFMFDHDLAPQNITRKILAYDCTWQTARKLIKIIPDVQLNVTVLEAMLKAAKTAIETNKVNCGSFDEAIFQLNALDSRQHLNCRKINDRYGAFAVKASKAVKETRNITIHPEWILSIIRQETAGVVRPRFEQHWLTKLAKKNSEASLAELRFRAMSFGLGQIMGFNYNRVGADSAEDLYTFPMAKQIISIARFLTLSSRTRPVVRKMNPTADDFKAVARYYNGSGFAAHHYDESLARWFREFKLLRAS
ncbi:MAG: N-acetylmuramidase domain-containing protein [Bacteroidota bacterium]